MMRSCCVFLFGHYGGENTGDQAMLLSCIWALRKRGYHVVYMTKNVKESLFPSYTFDDVIPIPRHPFKILQAVLTSQWIILGGGTHFHDDYKAKRLIRHYFYMSFIVFICILAKILRKKVAWISIGVGPFETLLGKFIFSISLHFVDFIAVRDQKSLEEINCARYKGQLKLSFDVSALLLDNDYVAELLKTSNTPHRSEKPILGIAPTLLHGSEQRVRINSYEFWTILAEKISQIAKQKKLVIRIIEMRGGSRESDSPLCNLFLQVLRAQGLELENIEYIPYSRDPLETLRVIAESQWFIASRFHSAVFAYLSNRPLLIIPYHRKLLDFSHFVGLTQEAIIDIESNEWLSQFERSLAKLLSNPSAFVAQVPVQLALKTAWLNFEFLES